MMSIRLDEEGIRFRIAPEGLALLLQGQPLLQHIPTGMSSVQYRIVPADSGDMVIEIRDMEISLSVPRVSLEALRDLGRSKKGIFVRQGNAQIALQVDMKVRANKAA
jgi:hypothetical protein